MSRLTRIGERLGRRGVALAAKVGHGMLIRWGKLLCRLGWQRLADTEMDFIVAGQRYPRKIENWIIGKDCGKELCLK